MASSSRTTLDGPSSLVGVAKDEPPQNVVIPSSFLILPPAAASLGLLIGLQRGGRRARLQFLAENAHRLPETYQGWYFYTKTRNYKVLLRATKVGGRYAVALGGATLGYCLLEEYTGWAREKWLGKVLPRAEGEGLRHRITWRQGGVDIWDGVLAGLALGVTVGTLFRLPRQLFIRSTILGTVLGGVESGAQVARDKIGGMRAEQLAKSEGASESMLDTTITDHPIVDRPIEQTTHFAAEEQLLNTTNALPLPIQQETEGRSTWSRIKGWVGGGK